MRELIRRTFIYSLSLFLTSIFLSGLIIKEGFVSFLWAGILLAIFSTILEPIIKAVTLPVSFLTFGLISFFSILVSVILLAYFYHNVAVQSFTLHGISILGTKTSYIHFSLLLSYVIISATIYLFGKIINFIFEK